MHFESFVGWPVGSADMSNARPATCHSHIKAWSKPGFVARGKTAIVACLLASAAVLGEPQVAEARNGSNAFIAGAILGGAMRGLGAPNQRVYRGGRSSRQVRQPRSKRSKEKQEAKQEEPLEKVLGTTPESPAGTTPITTSGSGAAPAPTPVAGKSGSAGSGGKASGRNGRRGSGALETVKSGLD
jgi:hypothetical protein